MRILHAIRTLDPAWGGPVHGLQAVTSAAQKIGIRPEIVCLDPPSAEWLHAWDLPVHALGASRFTYGYSSALTPWLSHNLKLFDAIIIEGIWMYISVATARAAVGQGVPYYVFTHGTLHPWFTRYRLKQLKKLLYWRLFEHRVLRDAAAVLFTTEREKRGAHNYFRPYYCNPAVVGYGIAPPPAPSAASNDRELLHREINSLYPKLRNRPYLLYLARITPKKGVDLLINAFSQTKQAFPHTALVIAGPADEKILTSLKSLASRLGLDDDIVWTGPVYEADKWMIMRGAEVYVLPSHHENFGVSVVEALACGRPVLISDQIDIWPEIQRHGAGLVDTADLRGTASLLSRWQALNAAEKQAMSLHAADCFATHFDVTESARRLFAVVRPQTVEDQQQPMLQSAS